MSEKGKIQLKTSSVLRIPLQSYEKFTFIVNGQFYETSRIIAELLSQKICQIHQSDPTINEYVINTQHKGQFSNFLKLTNFEEQEISEDEFQFIYEIISQLGNESLAIIMPNEPNEITNDNIISILQRFTKYKQISSKRDDAINYLSSHFFELNEEQKEEIMKIDFELIEKVLNNEKLQINDEDQLLRFINSLYLKDKKYSNLYCYIIFSNVSAESMKEFVEIYDINDINNFIWKSITERLTKEIKNNNNLCQKRYKVEHKSKEEEKKRMKFSYQKGNCFNGILNHLRNKSNGKIENEVNITSLSARDNDVPLNVTIFEDDSKYFYSKDEKNQWLCFDFKDRSVILSGYIIKSDNSSYHPKNWIIEGSNNQSEWETIDEQKNFLGLEKRHVICEFMIPNPKSKSFRYIRLRQTGKTWGNHDFLVIGSMELYGTLI